MALIIEFIPKWSTLTVILKVNLRYYIPDFVVNHAGFSVMCSKAKGIILNSKISIFKCSPRCICNQ